MKRNIFLSLLVAVVFSLICTVTLSQAGERTGVTDKDILIGGLGPMTGPASNLGPQIENGGKLAAKQINESGGIHGRKIKYLMGDTGCESSMGVALVKKMIFNDEVFAFHGLCCSQVGMAIRQMLEEEGVPILMTTAQSPRIMEPHSKYIFRALTPTDITGRLMGVFMRNYFKQKYTKVAILHTMEEGGATGKNALLMQLKEYGIEPLTIEVHKMGDTDYSGQLLKIKAVKPEVLFISSFVKDMALIAKQAHELGLECIKIGYNGSDFPIMPTLAGKEALENFYGPTTISDVITGEKLKPFVEMYKKEYPAYMKNPNNPSCADVGSYAGFQVMAEALKRAGRDLTRTKFIQALESIKSFEWPGYLPLRFSATQHEGMLELLFVRYVGGKAVPLGIWKLDKGMAPER